jgi:hypothetical protein
MNNQSASLNTLNDKYSGSYSNTQSLIDIFLIPGQVFEQLRKQPRFLAAMVTALVALLLYTSLLFNHVGYEEIALAEIKSSSHFDQMGDRDKEMVIKYATSPVFQYFPYLNSLIYITVIYPLGAFLYWMAISVSGRFMSYRKALSIWAYSSLPPLIILTGLNILLLYLKPTGDIDPLLASRMGLLFTHPGFLVDYIKQPVLSAALSSMDILSFYGVWLGYKGLRIVGDLTLKSSAAIVGGVWLIGNLARIAFAAVTGATLH